MGVSHPIPDCLCFSSIHRLCPCRSTSAMHKFEFNGRPETRLAFPQWNEAVTVAQFVTEANDFRQAPKDHQKWSD
jgi:hypothetical protein